MVLHGAHDPHLLGRTFRLLRVVRHTFHTENKFLEVLYRRDCFTMRVMIDDQTTAAMDAKPTLLPNPASLLPPSISPAKSQQGSKATSSHAKANKATTDQILARSKCGVREAVFPDLRNVGVLARALMLYIAMVTIYVIIITVRPTDLLSNLSIAIVESLTVAASVGVVWTLSSPALRRLAYWQAVGLMMVFTALLTVVFTHWMGSFVWRSLPLALSALAVVLVYFHALGHALSPAVTEARLQALQARIQPHFLFNSINGVLGVLRAEPHRAEEALINMADLFRVLMRENRYLQPIGDEVTLTRQYLDLEKLRLCDRLNVLWKLDKMPADALVPPLVLQPIAENEVYYGIELMQAAGTIEIEVMRLRSELIITVKNPFLEQTGNHHDGNNMAMSNIRKRLALHFDAEARMVSGPRDGCYQVQLVLPYRKSLDKKAMV